MNFPRQGMDLDLNERALDAILHLCPMREPRVTLWATLLRPGQSRVFAQRCRCSPIRLGMPGLDVVVRLRRDGCGSRRGPREQMPAAHAVRLEEQTSDMQSYSF